MKSAEIPSVSIPAASSENPYFSVIIPTYNRSNLIHKPVKSVLEQTEHSWELIIVDDGSTDDTAKVIQSFTDNRIRYVYQHNQERSAARNSGISHAKGKYICFLDSDDYYLPNHLESFRRKIKDENEPAAIFYCNTLEERDGQLLKFIPNTYQYRNAVEQAVQMSFGVPRTCIHQDVLKKYKFNPEIRVGEDVELWARALKEFPLIHNNDSTVVFVSHAGRTVDIGKEESFKAQIALEEKIFAEDKAGWISAEVRRSVLSSVWFRLAQHYIHAGRRHKAFFTLLRSLWINPRQRTKEKIYMLLQQLFITRWMLSLLEPVRPKSLLC